MSNGNRRLKDIAISETASFGQTFILKIKIRRTFQLTFYMLTFFTTKLTFIQTLLLGKDNKNSTIKHLLEARTTASFPAQPNVQQPPLALLILQQFMITKPSKVLKVNRVERDNRDNLSHLR